MRTKFSARGVSARSSAWVWTSTKPGATTRSAASIASAAGAAGECPDRGDTAVSDADVSAAAGRPDPSTTTPANDHQIETCGWRPMREANAPAKRQSGIARDMRGDGSTTVRERMRRAEVREMTFGAGSGDGGAETVVGCVARDTRSRHRGGSDDEIGIGVDVTPVDIDHTWTFTIVSPSWRVSSTRYFPGFTLNVKPPTLFVSTRWRAPVSTFTTSTARPSTGVVPSGLANRTADRAVGLNRLRAGVDDRSPGSAAARTQQQSGYQCGAESGGVRAVGSVCPHLSLCERRVQAKGHCAHSPQPGRLKDAFFRKWCRRRRVVKDHRSALDIRFGACGGGVLPRPPPRANCRTDHPQGFRKFVCSNRPPGWQTRNVDATRRIYRSR